MQKRILSIGWFVLLSFTLPLKASAATISNGVNNVDNIYVFGDSLSDDGNAFNATGFPPSPYYQGRFSNGPVWVEDLALDLGLTPNQQTNYAFGGATTGSDNTLIPGVQSLPGLEQQINSFTAANKSADPHSLYIVWSGANDYLDDNVTDPTVPVNNLSAAVTSLASVGAENIIVVNLPNLGSIPATISNSQISSSLNHLTTEHNSDLANTLASLSQNNNINIIPLDVNSLINKIVTTPTAYGFTNVTDSCLVGLVACTDPNDYFYWDDEHPTAAGHKLIADFAYSTLKPVPEPSYKFSTLIFGALGTAWMLKRKHKRLNMDSRDGSKASPCRNG